MTPQAVNWILKRRIALAGLDPKEFSAHGLRAGYLTEAARCGVSLPEAMSLSIAPCSRRRAITMKLSGGRAGRRG